MNKVNYRWDFRSSGVLGSVDWWLVTDVSGQTIGSVIKDQAVRELWVTNYDSNLRKVPEERKSHLQRGVVMTF
jgi:hypothetical protein